MPVVAHENMCFQDHNESESPTTNRVLAKIERYHAPSNSWKLASTLQQQQEKKQAPLEITLRRGGTIKLFPNLLAKETPCKVREELFCSGMFRQYQNQGVDEPRCQMLLHEDATSCFEAKQPGYQYNNTTLKSRSLKRFQELENLSKEMAALCNINKWTIGVNPVLYRDGKDRMGDHADDSQEETLILAVVVDSPTEARRVVVRPLSTLTLEDGDEKIELFMEPGDAYSMDGRMQKSYSHCVPRSANMHASEGRHRRLAIIFRTGREVWFQHDSGQPCPALAPRQTSTSLLGNGDLDLIEGECYARMEMYRTGAHRCLQRGVSGSKEYGCDAIVVSGKREDNLGEDHFEKLYYVADSETGALALLMSYEKSQHVRVFRSSDYLNVYRAPKPKVVTSTMYRYDGLYYIGRVTHHPPEGKKQRYTFEFERLDPPFNEIDCREYKKHCESEETLLAPNYREFLLWWDGSRIPELMLDREALYSHFAKRRPTPFSSSRSEQLAHTFFEFGMERLLLLYNQLLPLMESNPALPIVCGDNDGVHERTGNARLEESNQEVQDPPTECGDNDGVNEIIGDVQTIVVRLIGVKVPAMTLIATGIGIGKCGIVASSPTVPPVPFNATDKDVVRFPEGSSGVASKSSMQGQESTPISTNASGKDGMKELQPIRTTTTMSGKDGIEAKHPVKAASETDTDELEDERGSEVGANATTVSQNDGAVTAGRPQRKRKLPSRYSLDTWDLIV